jgi:hypothetical protein
MNQVQIAFYELEKFNQAFEGINLLDKSDVDNYFKAVVSKRRSLWLAVYESTKAVNPSLKSDIERGKYDTALTTNDVHYLDLNWQVLESDQKCTHCGKTNNHK